MNDEMIIIIIEFLLNDVKIHRQLAEDQKNHTDQFVAWIGNRGFISWSTLYK